MEKSFFADYTAADMIHCEAQSVEIQTKDDKRGGNCFRNSIKKQRREYVIIYTNHALTNRKHHV